MSKRQRLISLLLVGILAATAAPLAFSSGTECYTCDQYVGGNGPRAYCRAWGGINNWSECWVITMFASSYCYTGGEFCYIA